jgi:protein-S-isoprenylcysteine O-methyltransferase Ste14
MRSSGGIVPSMRYSMPRRLGKVVFLGQLAGAHLALPLELSRHGGRHGWREGAGRPSWANLTGLVPLLSGAAFVSWAVAGHYAAATDTSWAIKRAVEPEYLLTDGPYGFSRNPMYVGGTAIWVGWAVLLGSVPVAVGLVVLTGIYRAGVRLEEKTLEQRWGAEWLAYAGRVPRWLSLVGSLRQ